MDINNEVLIALVFERASLWDKKNKFYSKRTETNNFWKEISSEMNQDENKLRKRWRYLRDQFAVEFGKIPPSRSGDEATSVCPKWPYYKSLLFLKDVVKPRPATRRCTRQKTLLSPFTDQSAETADTETRSSTHDSDFSASPSPRHKEDYHESGQPSTSSMSMSQTTPQQVKRRKKSINDHFLHIEQQKLEQNARFQDEDNEHFLFFKSLIPHIERIPQHMVLSFRNRIQSVVEEFAYKTNPLCNPKIET